MLSFFVTATLRGELNQALSWEDTPPAAPAQKELPELMPKQTDKSMPPDLLHSQEEAAVGWSSAAANDDFVNVEKEPDDKDISEVENSTKRRKGRKKKN